MSCLSQSDQLAITNFFTQINDTELANALVKVISKNMLVPTTLNGKQHKMSQQIIYFQII